MTNKGLNWKILLAPEGNWAALAISPEEDMDNFVRSLPKAANGTVRIVRGARCATKDNLLQEWAAALQFPGHFGNNWDAFEDCLFDRDWLRGEVHVVIITSTNDLLKTELDELPTFLDILKSAAEGTDGAALRIVFHCETKKEKSTRSLLSKAGIVP